MPVSSRSRPFVFTFYPNGSEVDEGGGSAAKPRIIPVNSFAPIDIENEHFKGSMMIIHETGNEPGLYEDDEPPPKTEDMRGVELQIQGKFKKAGTGGQIVLWAGGELQDTMKLGWFMQKVVGMCANYAKKKTEGRLHINTGSKTELPQMGFPILQVFTAVTTKAGEEPPKLGSKELSQVPWQGAGEIDINSKDIYTLKYSTPFLDLCSWELLKVPGVSPLPLENLLGDIFSSRVMLYDLAVAGSHANWRKGMLIEWYFRRGAPGDKWHEDDILDGRKDDLEQDEKALPREQDGSHPPKAPSRTGLDDDEVSDVSEDSSHGEDIIDLIDDEHGEAQGQDGEDEFDSESSSADSLLDEDDEALSKAESSLLCELEGWRPREFASNISEQAGAEGVSIRMPFYIEAIDRRRRRKLRYWYVFAVADLASGDEWWHAKVLNEIASLCGKRRTLRAQLKTFRRGAARGCQCYGVQTLEQLRHVAASQLAMKQGSRPSRLKQAVLKAARSLDYSLTEVMEEKSDTKKNLREGARDMAANLGKELHQLPSRLNQHELKNIRPADLARKFRRNRKQQLPPRFLISTGKACELAFVHAREGRDTVIREGMVGAVAFEGRLCEELLRLSRDGVLRCFTPFDCDKPRLKLSLSEVMDVEVIDGLFLGRFWRWQVQTELRSFVFCSADQLERDEWIRIVTDTLPGFRESEMKAPNVIAATLMDTTRARRWRPKKRLVLNDRIMLDDQVEPTQPQIVEEMLEKVLEFKSREEQPASEELMEFLNLTCRLKAVRFESCSQGELLAFWMNVYHCLLVHGRLLLGTPKSRRELSRFNARVSYLVGLRPVSLREIERMIFRLPNLDSVTGIRATSRARARQFVGFCGLCRRRAAPSSTTASEGGGSSPNMSPRSPQESGASASVGGAGSSSSRSTPDRKDTNKRTGNKLACMPMISVPSMPRPPWSSRRVNACLFLGRPPEAFAIPKQDLRVVLCLNRGNHSCLADMPVFKAQSNMESQMDEVSREFVKEFVQLQERDDRCIRANLPHCCKCLKRELKMDMDGMLSFVWKFVPPERPRATAKMQVKFAKYRHDPRQTFQQSRLLGGGHVGSEYAVLTAAAQALAKLKEKGKARGGGKHSSANQESRSANNARDGQVVIDILPASADTLERQKSHECRSSASNAGGRVGSHLGNDASPSLSDGDGEPVQHEYIVGSNGIRLMRL